MSEICKATENQIRVACRGADLLPLDAIEPFQGSLKKRTRADIESVITSILVYGFSFPFFVWAFAGRNFCMDGHGRIEALVELRRRGADLPLFPVSYVDAKDEAEARQKLLRLNSQYGKMTIESILEFTAGLEVVWNDLSLPSGTLTIGPKVPATKNDDDAPEHAEPITEIGDVWEFTTGEIVHRLVCGDAKDENVIAAATKGERADLWLTDPPYNVDYVGKTSAELRIKNDKMSDADFLAFLTAAFSAATTGMKSGASFYIWHADSEGLNFRLAAKDAGLSVRQCVVWNKNALVMGRQDYQWKHEPCLYGWKEGSGHCWYSDRKQTTVLSFDRPSRSEEHPTMKPVDLFAYQIGNSTKAGDLVLDSFAGSGTALIACEKLGRRAALVEIEPKYCDVIAARYEAWAVANGRTAKITRSRMEGFACGR